MQQATFVATTTGTQFRGNWTDVSPDIFITALGIKPSNPLAQLEMSSGADAWGSTLTPLWDGFLSWELGAFQFEGSQLSMWDYAVGGTRYDWTTWRGEWTQSPGSITFAWSGESKDHLTTFNCIDTTCTVEESTPAFARMSTQTVVTPEPSVLAMLAPLMLVLFMLARLRHKR